MGRRGGPLPPPLLGYGPALFKPRHSQTKVIKYRSCNLGLPLAVGSGSRVPLTSQVTETDNNLSVLCFEFCYLSIDYIKLMIRIHQPP